MNVIIYHASPWSALFVDGVKAVDAPHDYGYVPLRDLQEYCPTVKVGDIREEWLDSAPLWTYLSEHGRFPPSEGELREYL